MNAFPELRPQTIATEVAFRVECQNSDISRNNQTFGRGGADDGSMGTYGTDLLNGSWQQSFDAHLSWERQPTPFISFYSTFQKAMARRRSMIRNGATNVVIIVVDLRRRGGVYDAYDIARRLGYQYQSADQRRRLEHHEGELILHGGISADEYRIMFCYPGDSLQMQEVKMSHLWNASIFEYYPPTYRTFLPANTVFSHAVDITDWIKLEIRSLTGAIDEFRLCILVLALSGQHWQIVEQDHSVSVKVGSPYFHTVMFAKKQMNYKQES